MHNSAKKEWTVFFLAKSIESEDTKRLIRLLKKIENTSFDPHIAVVFCINFNRFYLDALFKLDEHFVDPNSKVVFTTMFFQFSQGEVHSENRLRCIGEKEDFDITHADDVSFFFKRFVLNKYKAKNYLLFTWDHGNGFNIFHGIGQGGVNEDSKTVPILEMRELANAIKIAFGSNKIDLLIMMNCYMQMFDTGFALCEHVDYLVAPQSFMEFGEYDYEGIFSKLATDVNQKKKINAKELGEFVIQRFEKKKPKSNLQISCVNLSSLDDIYDFSNDLDELAELLITRVRNGQSQHVISFFKEADPTRPQKRFVDLGSVLKNMRESKFQKKSLSLTEDEIVLLDKLLTYLTKIIVIFFRKDGSNSYLSRDGCNGFSTISPVPIEVHNINDSETNLESHIWKSDFMKSSRWGELIYVLDILD
ncbi:clostripain-related cysteine peptidase [Reichenbachiella sp.]|uniref:clostripain-related cysteine peptidase n=1 Tax=Reichenbachiella sp. TaxID=2184521 RepID=UPI003BAFAA56